MQIDHDVLDQYIWLDKRILAILQAYKNTLKKLTKHMLFNLMYDMVEMTMLEYLILILCLTTTTKMLETQQLQDSLDMLVQLEEHNFMPGYHQMV